MGDDMEQHKWKCEPLSGYCSREDWSQRCCTGLLSATRSEGNRGQHALNQRKRFIETSFVVFCFFFLITFEALNPGLKCIYTFWFLLYVFRPFWLSWTLVLRLNVIYHCIHDYCNQGQLLRITFYNCTVRAMFAFFLGRNGHTHILTPSQWTRAIVVVLALLNGTEGLGRVSQQGFSPNQNSIKAAIL